jgi:hypothetical protein
MTSISETPLARLDSENRLVHESLKGPGSVPGSFLFRGDLAIHFAQQGNPSAPPALTADQVMLAALAGQTELSFYTCHLHSFETLKPLAALLGDMLGASGKYFVFCDDIKFSAKYRVQLGGAMFYVLPLDESSAFNALLETLKIERSSIKKLSLTGKIELLAKSVATFNPSYEQITYERGLEMMSPA